VSTWAAGAGHALLLAWLAVMTFLFHVPHTIALRNFLLVAGIVLIVAGWRRWPRPSLPASLRACAWALLVLTAWMALQAVLFSPTTGYALGRLRGDWLMHFVAGATAALIAFRVRPSNALRPVVFALGLAVALVLAHQAFLWLTSGTWILRVMPYAVLDFQSTVHGMLAALVIGDRACLVVHGKSPLALGARTGWLLCAFVLGTDVLFQARNGTVVVIALLLAGIALILWLRIARRRRIFALGAAALAAGLVALASWHTDKRWSGLAESYALGWTSESTCWHNYVEANCPTTPSGAPLEESAYRRAAWAREAVRAIEQHPLGLGYGHDAFGRALQQRYGIAGWGSSHSGWLDFALGVGLPGLVLLIVSGALAMRGGWRQFRMHDDGTGLLFSFFVGGYLLRCLLDGHLSGWRLGLFTFICGIIIASMRPRNNEREVYGE
jgi:hypothetical protein